jgi:hypothetical protein
VCASDFVSKQPIWLAEAAGPVDHAATKLEHQKAVEIEP